MRSNASRRSSISCARVMAYAVLPLNAVKSTQWSQDVLGQADPRAGAQDLAVDRDIGAATQESAAAQGDRCRSRHRAPRNSFRRGPLMSHRRTTTAFPAPMCTIRGAPARAMRSTCSACRSTKPENRKTLQGKRSRLPGSFPFDARSSAARCCERDWLGMLKVGGNIYYTIKIAFCDGLTFQDVAGMMSGVSKETYAQMMLAGGRSPEGNRYKDAAQRGEPTMARDRRRHRLLARAGHRCRDRSRHDGNALTGSRCSKAMSRRANGWPSWRRMSPSSSTTIMHRPFPWRSFPRS